MKVCIVSSEYPPCPRGAAPFHHSLAQGLAAAGHRVHLVTNNAWYGHSDPASTQPLWKGEGLTIHRLNLFGEGRKPPRHSWFHDLNPSHYAGSEGLWAASTANLAAARIAAYLELLHFEEELDLVESPDWCGEAFYILRRSRAGQGHLFPPVLIHGLGREDKADRGEDPSGAAHRAILGMERSCLAEAAALACHSPALLAEYEQRFGPALPDLRRVVPEGGEGFIPAREELYRQVAEWGANRPRARSRTDHTGLIGADPHPCPLPGSGLVVIDGWGATEEHLQVTAGSIAAELEQAREWRVAVLTSAPRECTLPERWQRFTPDQPPPWADLSPRVPVAWIMAGVRFDTDGLYRLLALASDSAAGSGAYPWLRPPGVATWPYTADLAPADLVGQGCLVPPALLAEAGTLAAMGPLAGLERGAVRMALLAAHAALAGGAELLHPGEPLGDWYGEPLLLEEQGSGQVLKGLTAAGLLPPGFQAPPAGRPWTFRRPGGGKASAPVPAREDQVPVDIHHLANLERADRQLKGLKGQFLFRVLRRLGLVRIPRDGQEEG